MQGPGVCPCCFGRQMGNFAARLADRVIPRCRSASGCSPFPSDSALRSGFDPALTTVVFRIFIAAVFAWFRRRARRWAFRTAEAGAVTLVQRFHSAVDLSLHFHAWCSTASTTWTRAAPLFQATPAPGDARWPGVAAVFRRVARSWPAGRVP